jgi:hypothetical protein
MNARSNTETDALKIMLPLVGGVAAFAFAALAAVAPHLI